MYGTDTINYAVMVNNELNGGWRGYRDQNGKPELQQGHDKDKSFPAESEVTVRRTGEFVMPVTLQVKFEDGSQITEHWDGQYRWAKFHYRGKKIAQATVDPEWKWKLEIPRVDNTWIAKPNTLAADKWYLRWVVWVENALNAFSYFS